MESLQKNLVKAIKSYNHFRSPEATAKLVKLTEDVLIVDFEGLFVLLVALMIGWKI